jgi:uncharacterized protein YceK
MKSIILMLTVAGLTVLGSGCASVMHHEHAGQSSVRPGPYPGVRTDVRNIGRLADAVKASQGGDKVVVACCVPLGAALFIADMPLSAIADSAMLVGDLNAANPHSQRR